MIKKRWYFFFISLVIGLLPLLTPLQTGATEEIRLQEKTLVVYDSKNQSAEKTERLSAFERLLLSFGQEVTSVSMADYKKGMLFQRKYQNLVTFINWPEQELESKVFTNDRAAFKGRKLHVGLKLGADEKAAFPYTFTTLYQRAYTLENSKKEYSEMIGVLKEVEVAEPRATIHSEGQLILNEGYHTKKSYPFALFAKKNAYLPFFEPKGAALLQGMEVVARWLGTKQKYNPYINILGLSPLVDLNIAEKLQEKLKYLENEIIFSAASTDRNNDLETFQKYIQILKQYTNNERAILLLNVPSLNNASDKNIMLYERLQQEISTFIENGLFPLGISAPAYWDFDRFYQQNALDLGKAILLYPFQGTPIYHTKTHKAKVYPLMFYCLNHKDLSTVDWHINGKYTSFQFPVPTSLVYAFPKNERQIDQFIQAVLHDPFPPTDLYFYKFTTGIETQTQKIVAKNGLITLNGVPVTDINFSAIQKREALIQKKAENGKIKAKIKIKNPVMQEINNILIIIILISLVWMGLLLWKGRSLYKNMYRKRRQK